MMDFGLQEFELSLRTLTKFALIEILREYANTLVKDGNPYLAALLREVANRYENSRKDVFG